MQLKQAAASPIFELFNEGLAFEVSTKEVEITVRGTKHVFNIKPVGFVDNAQFEARRTKFFFGNNPTGFENADDSVGRIDLETVANYTTEFEEITDIIAQGYGAEDKQDFVAKALGIDGVKALYVEIMAYTKSHTDEEDQKTDDFANEIKNSHSPSIMAANLTENQ